MDIPNSRLISADSTATEFQSEEGETANQHTVVPEQIDSPRSRESVCLKSRPGQEFRADRPFHPQGKLRENIRMNRRIVYQTLRRFIRSKIIIASTERRRRTSRGAPFLFCLVPPIAPIPHRPHRTHQRNPRALRSSLDASPRRRVAGRGGRGRSHRQRSSSGQHRTMRQGGNVWHRSGGRRATSFRPIASERGQSDAERGIGSDPTLNVEGGFGRNETLNVEGGVGRECRVISRRAERWRSGLKRPDDVSEGARAPPGRTGKGAVMLSKASLIGGGRS
jgi:hypothetical protein